MTVIFDQAVFIAILTWTKYLVQYNCVSKSSYETSSFKFTAEQLIAVLSFHHITYYWTYVLKKFIMAQFHLFC